MPVILTGAIVGASVTIVLALVLVVGIMCCLRFHRKRRNPTITLAGEDSWEQLRASLKRNTDPKPLYDSVFAEHKVPVRSNCVAHKALASTQSTGSADVGHPRELLAYNHDIPSTFKPFPPPPLVTVNQTQAREAPHTYDTPEVLHSTTADRAVTGYYDIIKRANLHETGEEFLSSSVGTIPHYDEVEVLHDNSSVATPSLLQLSTSLDKGASKFAHASMWHPKKDTLHRDEGYDHTYCEPLEPSMLQNNHTLDPKERGLPYAPIYDTPKPLRNSDSVLLVSPSNIVEIRDLGVGRFGKVALAATKGLSLKDLNLGENDRKNRSLLVAIKKLRRDAGETLREAFESEIKFMWRMKHANVVRLLGVCRSAGAAQRFLVMEYMENGDLCGFLQKQTVVADTVTSLGENQVTPLILLYVAVQIASGMRYLASQRFIHRDLATRNCLVGRDFVVKISDFGMSRNLYESFYYRVHSRLSLPIRWMAFETFYGRFSVRSDVWSYGVVLWEIYTLGKREPYHGMSDEELIIDAMRGPERSLLSRPPACPANLYDIMKRCWVHEPLMRADFEEVYSRLFMSYIQLSKQA